MKLQFVLGTAAELIKVYPLIVLAGERGHDVRVSATGQSRENLLMQYADFKLPERHLDWLWESSGDLDNSTAALKWFWRAWSTAGRSDFPADYVIVHGDTLSTWVGARFASKRGIPVGHVEAGLRSNSLLNPFPEEITRRRVSKLARMHFAPDEWAHNNLRAAKVKGDILNTCGNTLIDAVRMAGQSTLSLPQKPFVLVNIHRYENLNSGKRWRQIVETLLTVAQTRHMVMVSHPQTRAKLESEPETIQKLRSLGVDLRDRMPFSAFMALLKNAEYLISDGGSNQEECSYLGKPCLLLREATERVEGLDSCCVLTRFQPQIIETFLRNPAHYNSPPMDSRVSPCQKILEYLEQRHTATGRKSSGASSHHR